jgi:uncharacterized membrane protein (Fun14 family)
MTELRFLFGLQWPGKNLPLSFYLKVIKYLSIVLIIVGSHWFMAIALVGYGNTVASNTEQLKNLTIEVRNLRIANRDLMTCINKHNTALIDGIAVNCQK